MVALTSRLLILPFYVHHKTEVAWRPPPQVRAQTTVTELAFLFDGMARFRQRLGDAALAYGGLTGPSGMILDWCGEE